MVGIPEQVTLEDVLNVNHSIGIEKRCPKCKEVKLNSYFYIASERKDGLRGWCKMCQKEKAHDAYPKTHERQMMLMRKWRLNNQERYKERSHEYYSQNKEKCFEATYLWRRKNPQKVKEINNRKNAKRSSTPMGRINNAIRSTISRALKGNKRGRKWMVLTGYNLKQLKEHLENQFTDGMSWDNYGKWHIDHKIPITAFNFENPEDIDFKRCWSLKNLQPLWAVENISKHNKINHPFQPSLLI